MARDADEQAWIAAGILDPDADNADEMRALLRFLTERGARLDDLRVAADPVGLTALAGELWQRGTPRLTARELAAQAGLDLATLLQVAGAAGLATDDPDAPMYRPEDVETFRLYVTSSEIFGEEAVLEFTRTMGTALASIADAATALFGINVVARFDELGLDLVERAKVSEAASMMLRLRVPGVIETLFFHHVEAAIQRAVESSSTEQRTARLAVAFVDIVESTMLVQRLPPDVLAEALGTFEQLATEVVASRQGRVVKTLGDEVMFVVTDAAAACGAALALRDAVAEDERLPGVRGAVAYGDLVRGYGDFYGTEVTAAARAAKVADAGTIVTTRAVCEAVREGFTFTSIGPRELRGFAEPIELFRVERA